MNPKDYYRAANLLLGLHGAEAGSHALKRREDMRSAGDAEGEAVWLRVLDAMADLQIRQPRAGGPVH